MHLGTLCCFVVVRYNKLFAKDKHSIVTYCWLYRRNLLANYIDLHKLPTVVENVKILSVLSKVKRVGALRVLIIMALHLDLLEVLGHINTKWPVRKVLHEYTVIVAHWNALLI